MTVDTDELAEYYAGTQPSLCDAYGGVVPPRTDLSDPITSPVGSGLVIPLSGRAHYVLDGVPYELKPGVVLHAGAAMSLEKRVVGDEAWACVLVHYRIPTADEGGFPLYNSHFCIETGPAIRLQERARCLHTSERADGHLASLRSRALFADLIGEVVSAAQRHGQTDERLLIDDALAFLGSHYAEDISVQRLAALYGTSARHFGYLFSKHVGVSPLRYLTDLRIRQAKELLATGLYTVGQVAQSVGINDSYYFSRLFKKHTGERPKAFKELRMHAGHSER
jgi:AraC-like DNA-binding protein